MQPAPEPVVVPEPIAKQDDPPANEPAISSDAVRKSIKDNAAPMRLCFEKAEQAQQRTKSRANMEWTVDATGKVIAVRVTGVHPDFEACLVKVIKTFQYPPLVGGGTVVISYPFVFRPGPS